MPYSSAIQIVNDPNNAAYAFLADNGNLYQGQWNAEAQRWDQGRIVPGAYGARDLQVLVVDNLWPSSGSSGAVPGNAPGVVLAYRLGSGASAQVVASFAAWGPDGSLSWSEPLEISSGQGENEAFGLAQGQAPGTVQLVLQKRDPSSSPQNLLSQFRDAPQEVINQKLDALATGARTDSDLYLTTLEILPPSGQEGYQLQQSGNGNAIKTGLTLESDPQITAPPAAPSGGNTLLSRSALAANAAPPLIAPAPAAAPTLLASPGLLGAAAPADSPVSFATSASVSSQGGGISGPFFSKSSGRSLADLTPILVPWRWTLGGDWRSEQGKADQKAAYELDQDRMEFLSAESNSSFEGDLKSSSSFAQDMSGENESLPGENELIPGDGAKQEVPEPKPPTEGSPRSLGDRLSSIGRPPIVSDNETQRFAMQNGLGSEAKSDTIFKGLFGGALLGQGGLTVANFSTLARIKGRNSTQRALSDQGSLYLPTRGSEKPKILAYDSGWVKGGELAGSLKTIYQYGNPGSGGTLSLKSYVAEETFGADFSLYRAKIFDNGFRLIGEGSLGPYLLLEQRYASDSASGLPQWLRDIGLGTAAAGDTFSALLTLYGIAGSGYSLGSGQLARAFNPLSSNGLGFRGETPGSTTKSVYLSNTANGVGLASAILSAGTVAGAASSDFNQYGTATWGVGAQLATRVRAISKWGIGLECIGGLQANFLWNFAGIKPVPDVQVLAFGSVGATLAFGAYIPLLNASWKWNSKPTTTSSTELSAAAMPLAAASPTTTSSGRYVEVPTGDSYPMSYAPSESTDAYYTSSDAPLASLTSNPSSLYLYQLSGFSEASLDPSAIVWKNSGNGALNDGVYANVPLIGISLPGSATATASFTVSGGSIDPASFSLQLPTPLPGQPASGQYLALPQGSSGVYSFGVDVFQPVLGNPAPPTANGALSVHAVMPLFNIDTGNTTVLEVSSIARIPQQVAVPTAISSITYPLPDSSGSSSPGTSNNDSKITSLANVPVQLLAGAAGSQQAQPAISPLNPVTATVTLLNGQIISVTLDQPLYFADPTQVAGSCTLVVDLAAALNEPTIVNPNLTVTAQLQGLPDFTDQNSFTANPTASNAGVYLSAGLIDTLPLLSSFGNWPVQNRVTYVDGANTVYLNNTASSSGNWSNVTPSDLTLSQLSQNPDKYQFSAASEPTAITDLASGTTFVFWVEASEPVTPLSGSDGEENYQAFMNALYGNQRINYSYTTTSQSGTSTAWNYISPADLHSSPGNIITNLRAFNVQVQVNGQPQTRSLLVWSELPISALQNAALLGSAVTGADEPQAKLYAGFINPEAASVIGGYQWNKLFNDSDGISTIQEIPWSTDSGSGLSIADLSAASQLIQVEPVTSLSGSISGTSLRVSQLGVGSLAVGDLILGAGVLPGTTITALPTQAGGSYSLSQSQSIARSDLQAVAGLSTDDSDATLFSAAFSGSGNTILTVASGLSSSLEVGDQVYGVGLAPGTLISAVLNYDSTSKSGTYTLSRSPLNVNSSDSYALLALPSDAALPSVQSVLTPVLSWSQAVRTPYNEAVLDSQPQLFLPLGQLQSGSNAINVGAAEVNTETYASSTGLNTAIAGALPKSTASAVQNVEGLGVLVTGLGSTNKPILDLLRNIPQADRNSAQSDPIAIFSGTIDGTTLSVSSLSQGSLEVGELLVGAGVTAGTTITAVITAATATTPGVYTLSTASSVASSTTLRTLPESTSYSYSSFNGSFSGAGGSNGYTTLTISDLSGALQIGDRVLGTGLPGGCFIEQVQSFDANTGTGVYTVNQGPESAGGSYGLAALPGGSSSPYSIEFWTQLAPNSNPAGAGLVNLGQASAAALPDRPAAAPEGWLLSSSFAVELITNQDALKLGLLTALPTGESDTDTYGWRWALVADGANTTAMDGNGGANLNRNALVLDNFVVGDRIEGVNTFLANYGLTSSDLLGIDGTPADQIAAVPSTQLQFSTELTANALVQATVAETTLNGVAIDTSSAVMNGAIVTKDQATEAMTTMFDALWTFEQKTGQAKVNFSLNPDTQTNLPTPSTPPITQLESYRGFALQFALLQGPAVSINGSGRIAFDVAPGQTLFSTDGTDLRDNSWHYVVVSFLPDYVTYKADGSLVDVASNVGTASLYIDGKQVASVANVVNPYAPSNVNDYAQLLSDNATGAIDLVAVYNKALTTLSEPQSVSAWPLPTSTDALALMKEAGFVVATKTPNPGAIPGAVSNHWLAHTVDPNNAANSTYTATLIPDGTGGGKWTQASGLNPLVAPQASTPSASTTTLQQDLLIAINSGDWAQAGWFLDTSTAATAFSPAGNDLQSITVTLTSTTTGDSVIRTLTPEQVLLGSKAQKSLAALQPQAQDQDFNYTFLSNTPALNLLISRQPGDSSDSNTLDPRLSYTAKVTLTFEGGTTVSNSPSGGNSPSSGTGLPLGFSSSLASELKSTDSTRQKALATAEVLEQAPLQLKYVDSGEVFSSKDTATASPASSFGASQAAGYYANSSGSNNGWLAIAQPRSSNAKNNPAGRVWINYTGQFTLNATTNVRTASTDAANAPKTWLNALANSNFNPQAPNLPLLDSANNQSSVGGLLIKADASAGWGQNFGANMLVADVNDDGTADLIISAPQANGGGAVVIIDGKWIANNLTATTGETILDLSNPSNLGSYVTVLTPGTVNTTTDITTAAGFGSAMAFDTTTNTLWIGAPNYLRTLDASKTANASTQPIGALYSYSTSSSNPNGWDSATRTPLTNPILGTGGTLTTTQAGNSSSTSWWGSQFGTAVAVSSSGQLAVSSPGVVAAMLYTGTEESTEKYTKLNLNFKPSVPTGLLKSIALGPAIDFSQGTSSPGLKPISSLTSLSDRQTTYLTKLIDQATTQVASASTQNNQALQSAAVGAVAVFNKGTNFSSLAGTSITPEAIARLSGTTFIGANAANTKGDTGFGSSLTFADLTNSNGQQLIVGASSSNGGGLVYTIDPSAPGTDTSLGSNQYLAVLAATNVFSAAEAFDGLGNGLVSLGDVNKDGYDDVLLQAYNASSGAGNAYLLFGGDQIATTSSNQGLASLASGNIGTISFLDGTTKSVAILSELGSAGALTGQGNYGAAGLAGTGNYAFGDINADGYDDIPLGSGALANAYLTSGHAYLESISTLQLSRLTSNSGFMLDGLATTTQGSLRSIGDFNGDGYGDFISISPGTNLTSVRIELGSNTQEILADAAYSYYNFTVANGTQVMPGGDINGDGMDDIVLFLDQNLSSSTPDGNQGAGSTTGILYGRNSGDLPLGSGFGFIAPVDPSTSAPLAPLPGANLASGLTDSAPSVIAVGTTLYAVVKGVGSTDTTLWFTQSNDGGNTWNGWTDLSLSNAGFATALGSSPSLAYFNETLYISFVNSSGTLSLSSWDPTSNNPASWSAPTLLSGTTAAAAAFSSSTAPQLLDRGDSLGVLWVQDGVVYAASTTEPDKENNWTNPQELNVLEGGSASAIGSSDAPSFTWLGTTPVLAVNEGGTIQVYAGQGGGATLQLASSLVAPTGLSIASAPVLTTTDTGLALTFTNSDGSISLQRLNLVSPNGTPLPGVQFTSDGGIDVSQAALKWQSTILTESNSGISSSLASVPVSVNGNLLLTNVRNSASENTEIWINAVPNASDPDSTTWLNSTVQLPDGNGGWSISQQASSTPSFSSPTWSVLASGSSPTPPVFAEADGVLYAAVQGNNNPKYNGGNAIYTTYSNDGGKTWAGWVNLPITMNSLQAPGIAVLDGTAYLAYVGTNGQINITSTTASSNSWRTPYQIQNQAAKTLSMVVEDNNLVIYYQGTNDNIYRTSTSTPSSSSWQENSVQYDNGNATQTCSGQLAATVLAGTTYLAYQGGTSGSPSNTIYLTSSSTQSTDSSWSLISAVPQASSSTNSAHSGVGLTSFGDSLMLSYADQVNGSPVLALQQGTVIDNNWRGVPYANLKSAGSTTSPAANLFTPSGSSQVLVGSINANSGLDISTTFAEAQPLSQLLSTAQTGSSLTPVGDLNNDGFADLLVTANNAIADTSSGLQLATGLRVISGAATSTAITSLNNNDDTATSQSVLLASPFSQGSATPVTAITGSDPVGGTLTIGIGARNGTNVAGLSASVTPTALTAASSSVAEASAPLAGITPTSQSLASSTGWGNQALNSSSSFGDLNGDGRLDCFDPAGNNAIATVQGLSFSLWSIRAAGDVNGNGVDDLLLSLAPQGPGYGEVTTGQPSALQSVLVDGSLFDLDTSTNSFRLDQLKAPLNPYGRNQLYDVASTSTSEYKPSLQNWFDPILSFKPGSLTAASTGTSTNPGSAAESFAPSCAVVSPEGETTLFFTGADNNGSSKNASGLWMAYQDSSGNWQQMQCPVGSNANNTSPSAAYFEGKLYVAYTDVSHNIYIACCSGSPEDSASWTSYQVETTVDESTAYSPTLIAENGRLGLYFPTNNGGAYSTTYQYVRYLYSKDPSDSAAYGNWGASLSSATGQYTGISGQLDSSYEVTSPIAATTFQGRTVLAFRSYSSGFGYNTGNGNIVLLTQVASAPTASTPSSTLSWVEYDTQNDNVNGVGLTTDQALLYLTTAPNYSTTQPKAQIWSLQPVLNTAGQADGSWTMGDAETLTGPTLWNSTLITGTANSYNVATVFPFMNNGQLMATWTDNNRNVQIADLSTTIGTPTQQSLAGYSLDGNIDINGDGFRDIVLSDPSDPSLSVNNQYALFGGDFLNIASQVGTNGDDELIGTLLDDVIYSLAGSDSVLSNGGTDVIYTASGDDQISIVDNGFRRIDAGSGFDVLQLEGLVNQNYDFRLNVSAPEYFAGTKLRDFELITSRDHGANVLRFDAAAINAINGDRIVFLTPDEADTIILSDEFQANPAFDTTYGGTLWNAYAAGVQSTPADSSPTLIYVRNPNGGSASDWLSSHVIIDSSDTTSLGSAPTQRANALAATPSPTAPSSLPIGEAPISSTPFGDLTVSAYKTNPAQGCALFEVFGADTSTRRVFSYVSSNFGGNVEAGRDVPAVFGTGVLEVGQSSTWIAIPIPQTTQERQKGIKLSLALERLPDIGQTGAHFLVTPESSGLAPSFSGLTLNPSEDGTSFSLGFRADATMASRKGGHDLQLNIGQRASAVALDASFNEKVVLSDAVEGSTPRRTKRANAFISAISGDSDQKRNAQVSTLVTLQAADADGYGEDAMAADGRFVDVNKDRRADALQDNVVALRIGFDEASTEDYGALWVGKRKQFSDVSLLSRPELKEPALFSEAIDSPQGDAVSFTVSGLKAGGTAKLTYHLPFTGPDDFRDYYLIAGTGQAVNIYDISEEYVNSKGRRLYSFLDRDHDGNLDTIKLRVTDGASSDTDGRSDGIIQAAFRLAKREVNSADPAFNGDAAGKRLARPLDSTTFSDDFFGSPSDDIVVDGLGQDGLDPSAIEASTLVLGDQPFAFFAADAFSGGAGQFPRTSTEQDDDTTNDGKTDLFSNTQGDEWFNSQSLLL